MINALLALSFVDRLKNVPWEVVPYAFLGLAAIVLLFWLLNKILTPFFGSGYIDYCEEENDYE